ncbi:probable thiopurine S-methyltransferase [Pecten maximus]|uniref:probable thiopurine S-methyltransferase n=1 Tax=Pecten maximus TaxID=6579 RepID=UPI0014588845|nr:probable thiopurine S-methyltransferase [Pecten maximus]XP_033757786.1 probable thiopurine S-methyltransferase [Pecten maximus]XP_033757787.1 probable thiopurine S-methyltransferase [Pecten maximus]
MDDKTMQGWLGCWEKKTLPWHNDDVHEAIEKHHEILMTSLTTKNKIFIPLCGKTVDIKWLADRGNEVVGLEASEIAVKDFFTEQNIKYTSEDAPAVKGKLYRSTDNKIKVYCCDLFLFSAEIESGFSGIWDRGSLVAISPADQKRYFELMKTLVHPGIGYLLEMPDRDPGKGDPNKGPFCISFENLQEGFGPDCSVTKLCAVEKLPPKIIQNVPGMKEMNVLRLTFK